MGNNTQQANPSDATADFVQPDWNSKHGTGTDSDGELADFNELYVTAKDGERERREAKKPQDPGLE
jgi:hypothetical protein